MVIKAIHTEKPSLPKGLNIRCKNCGATFEDWKCKYCGTKFPNNSKK